MALNMYYIVLHGQFWTRVDTEFEARVLEKALKMHVDFTAICCVCDTLKTDV